jgi:hypothetical protein
MKSIFPACCLLLAAACAETGGSSSYSSAGSYEPPRSAERALSAKTFPAETVAFMKNGLHQFSAGDPKWEQTRAQWLAMGPDESDALVQYIWTALLRFQTLDRPREVEKARHELAVIGGPSVPLLTAFLVGGTIRTTVDRDTGERKDVVVDDAARDEASRILGLIGAPSTSAVREALEQAPTKSGKRFALLTLGYIGERGGDAASEPLVRYARDPDDVLRVVAVDSLQFFHDEGSRSALIQALGDPESLVRRKAAESLRNRHDAAAAAYIRGAAERARGEAKLVEAAELDKAAASIERWNEEQRRK